MDRSHLNVLQMALTNELKRRFPNATHNYYVFRGLRFRPEYGHLMKLADSSQGAESGGGNEESEELPGFEDDHLADD